MALTAPIQSAQLLSLQGAQPVFALGPPKNPFDPVSGLQLVRMPDGSLMSVSQHTTVAYTPHSCLGSEPPYGAAPIIRGSSAEHSGCSAPPNAVPMHPPHMHPPHMAHHPGPMMHMGMHMGMMPPGVAWGAMPPMHPPTAPPLGAEAHHAEASTERSTDPLAVLSGVAYSESQQMAEAEE